MSAILPKYKCQAIAREVTRLLNLSPALNWRAVRDYAAPRLPGMRPQLRVTYPPATRRRIADRLDIELAYQHLWTNR